MFLPDPSGHRDVALGLCRGDGRVLLVLNARSAQGLATRYWDLPGGTVEAGEDLKAALAREWKEEVGWVPTVGDLLLVVDGKKRIALGAPPLYTWRAFVFDVPAPPFGVFPTAGEEIERVDFLKQDDAAMRLIAPYQAPVRNYLRGWEARHAHVDWIEPEAKPGEEGASAPIDAATRRLLVIAAAAAIGESTLVASEVAAAAAEGVDRARLEETLLQIVPYAGFPRALAAFAAARPTLGQPATDEASASRFADEGEKAFAAVYGESAPRVESSLARLHPLLPAWTKEFAYGRVLARPALDLATRELVAVAVLTALGRADDALLGHMRAAARLTGSKDAVAGAVAVVPASAGPGKRAAARELLEKA